MTDEMLKQVNDMLNRDIDPVYFEIARKISPDIRESKYIPWLLAHKIDLTGAQIINVLPDEGWSPELEEFTASEAFLQRLHMDRERVDAELKERYYSNDLIQDPVKGLIVNPDKVRWMDYQTHPEHIIKNGEAYYHALQLMVDEEFFPLEDKAVEARTAQHRTAHFRVVPRYDAVKDCPDLLPTENYKELLRSREIVSLMRCSCRIKNPEYGQTDDVCVLANEQARLMIKRGIAKEMPWEEVFEHIQAVGKKERFIQTAKPAMELDEKLDYFCNCNVETCGLLRGSAVIGSKYPIWEHVAKSRFRAHIDAAKCVDCGLCKNKRCMFGAIRTKYYKELGQVKLYVNDVFCMGCGSCAETCPTGAMKLVLVDPPEVLSGFMLDENGKPMRPEAAK